MTPEQRQFVRNAGNWFANGDGVMVIDVIDTTTNEEVALLGHPYQGKFIPVAIMLTDAQKGRFKAIEKEPDEPAETKSIKAIFDLLDSKKKDQPYEDPSVN
jgi:hypothetical protein